MIPQTSQDPTIDQDALRLSRAIGLKETGKGGKPDYNAVGDNGTSSGAYQWQPGNFARMAQKYGLDPKDFSPVNQDKTAYSQVKEWKDQGYQPAEIASMWNSGRPDKWKDHKGTTTINGKKIAYDTPAYVVGVKQYYEQLKGANTSTSPAQTQIQPTQEEGQSGTEKVLRSVVGSFTKPLNQAFSSAGYYLGGKKGETQRLDQTSGEKFDILGYREGQELGGGDTLKQVGGNLLMNAANVLVPGEGKLAIEATKAGLLKSGLMGAKSFAKVGAAYSGGEGLEEGRTVGQSLGQAAVGGVTAGALGLGFGVAGKGLRNLADTAKLATPEGARASYTQAIDSGLGKYGKGTGDTMFDYGIDHNQTGSEAAYQIRNEIARKANDNLTEVLKTQNNYTPVDTWLKDSLSNIDNGTGRYSNIETEIRRHVADIVNNDPKYARLIVVNAEGKAMLPDWALNELKQQNWQNSKFAFSGDPSITDRAQANLAMGRGARKIIEKNTKGLNVGEYNKELGRLYDAADVLEKKGDKALFTEKYSHLLSKVTGGIVGSHQGIIGTIVGMHAADTIADAIMKVPMVVRKELADRFAKAGKSDLFEQAETLLEQMKKTQSERLKLPAPSYMEGKPNLPKPGMIVTQGKYGEAPPKNFEEAQRLNSSPSNASNPAANPGNITPQTNKAIIPEAYPDPYVPSSELPTIDAGKGMMSKSKLPTINIEKATPPNTFAPEKAFKNKGKMAGLLGLPFLSPNPVKEKKETTDTLKPTVLEDIELKDRGVTIKRDEVDLLRGVLFAEISNAKDKDEIRHIINTAINRTKQDKKNKTIKGVLTAPNAYQGYNSKEYKRYEEGKLNDLDKKKLQLIDEVINELNDGKFPDTTKGSVFYKHEKGLLKLGSKSLYK